MEGRGAPRQRKNGHATTDKTNQHVIAGRNSCGGVDPALAETRTARNGEAVIEYQIDGKGPAVLMIASLGRPGH